MLPLSCARLLWGMAEDGALPGFIAEVGEKRQTPWKATVGVTLVAAGVHALESRIESVANLTNTALFAAFIVINAAVIALRFKEPDTERPFRLRFSVGRVPITPVLGIASVLVLAVHTGIEAMGIAMGTLAVGVVVYLFGRRASGEGD